MRFFIFIMLLGAALDLGAQEGRLADFSVNQLDRSNAQISWTMKAGVSCESPQVQRSTDSVNFNSIYRYPGVCGGGEEQETYSWIDNQVIQNSRSYYRLKIDEGEFSRIVAIEARMDFSKNAVRLYPQPAEEVLKLAYFEELGQLEEIRMFNNSGREITVELISDLKQQPIQIRIDHLAAGLYVLWLDFEMGEPVKAKFVKSD